MLIRHRPIDAMRAYLLGQLPEREASALEEEYFVNRATFLRMQAAETSLIAEYLDGRLPRGERRSFERRYLQTPQLRLKVEEVRRERGAGLPPPLWPRMRLRLATALTLALAIGLGIFLYRDRTSRGKPAPSAAGLPATASAVVVLHLTPGLTKGSGASASIEQPAPDAAVSLVLELPGSSSPVERTVRIFAVKPEGGLKE